MAECLAHPMYRAPVFAKCGDGLRATGDVDGVIHGGALALEVVVCDDPAACAGFVFTRGEDLVAAGGDGEGEGAGSGEGRFDAVVGELVVAVCDEDGDHAGGDGGGGGHVFELGQARCFLVVLGAC